MTGSVEPTVSAVAPTVSLTELSRSSAPEPTASAPPPTAQTYPPAPFPLVQRYIDEPQPLRVAVIGAGLSGILAGALLPAKVPGISLTIYEKNPEVSGTWFENTYPGVRCDIPSHVYQSTFEPNTQWSDEFSYGPEIRDYWKAVAAKYNVYDLVKLQHRVDACDWDAARCVWIVTVTDLSQTPPAAVRAEADVVITATGRFNAWKLPEYPGIETFAAGPLFHASNWPRDFDPAGKRVAVIGNGASGIQLVANLQPRVAQLDHYARSRTWIATSWAGDERTAAPQPYAQDQKDSFARDPSAYLAFRKALEDRYWRRVGAWFKDTPESTSLAASFAAVMRRRLRRKPELADALVPDFAPNCRRLTPGPGYLEALTEPNVALIQTPIARFTASGITAADGTHRPVDAVVCATGAHGDMVPQFPVRGAGGVLLSRVWARDGAQARGFPYTYLGVGTPGFPNLFFVQGPHGTGPAGTVPHAAETQITYVAKLLRKMAREGVRSMAPRTDAADDFVQYSDAFFNTTVLADGCSSWYNGGMEGARIHGVWPGSAAHLALARKEPRWEDWEYEYRGPAGNRFAWFFGNGRTRKEADETADCTEYLREGPADLRAVHEGWWE